MVIDKILFVFGILKSFSKERKKLIQRLEEFPTMLDESKHRKIQAKTTKPDLDNLEKLLMDAMNGIVYTDDSIVCEKNHISKIYGLVPQIQIIIKG